MADRFKALGYATVCIGKWHLGAGPESLPMKRGFDRILGTVATGILDQRHSWIRGNQPWCTRSRRSTSTPRMPMREGRWTGSHGDAPFLLYPLFNAQHAPLQATKKYKDRFPHIADEKHFCRHDVRHG